MSCELCEAAPLTRRYFENEQCWIADCEICLVPMVVWREHDVAPPEPVRAALLGWLGAIADDELGRAAWYADEHMRNIPDHYHAHARRRRALS